MNRVAFVVRPARLIRSRAALGQLRSFSSVPVFEAPSNQERNTTLHVPYSAQVAQKKASQGEKPIWETHEMTSANASRIIGGTILLQVGDGELDEVLRTEVHGFLFSLDGKLPLVRLSGSNLKQLPQIAQALQIPADNECALFLLAQGRMIDSLFPLNFPPEDQQERIQTFMERLALNFGTQEKLAQARVRAGAASPGTAAMQKGLKFVEDRRYEDAIEQYKLALQQPEVNGQLRVEVQCHLVRAYVSVKDAASASNLLEGLPDVPCVRGARAMVSLVDDVEFIAAPHETTRKAIAALKQDRNSDIRERVLRYLTALNDPVLRKEFNKVWFI